MKTQTVLLVSLEDLCKKKLASIKLKMNHVINTIKRLKENLSKQKSSIWKVKLWNMLICWLIMKMLENKS